MVELKKISMGEKRQLVDRVVQVPKGAVELFLEAEVAYMTMFPRHVAGVVTVMDTCQRRTYG
jgi:hypothetical protein